MRETLTSPVGNIHHRIMALALPAIFSNITVPLMGLCDTAISGHLGDPLFLAAIATGTMMINVVGWLCGFLRMGTTGLTAEAYGAADYERSRVLFCRSVYFAFMLGFVVVALSPLLSQLLLWIISPGREVMGLAHDYYLIVIFGLPAQLATMAVSGWFIGMQTTVRPMIVAISTNILNIIFSLIVVFIFHRGFVGIAYGTLIANWVGLAIALLLCRGLLPSNHLFLSPMRAFRGEQLTRFFKVNSDLFLRSACIMSVSLAVTSIGARLGDNVLAANAVAMQFFLFFSYFMDGFAFCGEALCGRAVGEKNAQLFVAVLKGLSIWGFGMLILMTVVYSAVGEEIVGLLTDSPVVRGDVMQLRWVIITIPALSVMTFLLDGVYIGLTATRRMLYSTLTALILFVIIVVLTPESMSGGKMSLPSNTMLWCAFLSYLFARGALLAFFLPSVYHQNFPTKESVS